MSATIDRAQSEPRIPLRRGDPAWNIALLFPSQGRWTEEEFLLLESLCENRMIELADGCLEVLPRPDLYHQRIVKYLFQNLASHVTTLRIGEVHFAPLPVRLWPNQLREPDIILLRPKQITSPRKPPDGADLAMEVVSPGDENRERDLKVKRREYAKARIKEYWIVDPEEQAITVLTLVGRTYRVHGTYAHGATARSKLLAGFAMDVSAALGAGDGTAE